MKIILVAFIFFLNCVLQQADKPGNELNVKDTGYIILVDPVYMKYAIRTMNSRVYIPVYLETKFRRAGLKVAFEGLVDTVRLKNVRLAGIPINIDKVAIRP